jgi:hypothetical protein
VKRPTLKEAIPQGGGSMDLLKFCKNVIAAHQT